MCLKLFINSITPVVPGINGAAQLVEGGIIRSIHHDVDGGDGCICPQCYHKLSDAFIHNLYIMYLHVHSFICIVVGHVYV